MLRRGCRSKMLFGKHLKAWQAQNQKFDQEAKSQELAAHAAFVTVKTDARPAGPENKNASFSRA
jgi:hypothetical protein